jgi:hypothetical protein
VVLATQVNLAAQAHLAKVTPELVARQTQEHTHLAVAAVKVLLVLLHPAH